MCIFSFQGQTEVVQCLLEDRKVAIDIPDNLTGETALTAAAAGGHVATCQALMQKSASVMVPNAKVSTFSSKNCI